MPAMATPAPATVHTDRFTLRVPKTAELVAGRIRRQIVLGELKEGDALPSETALMAEFDISRPTLREAFRILESEGLINVRRGARGGARVQVPSEDVAARSAGLVLQYRGVTLADVLEARVVVEAPAARTLAKRRDRAASADELTEVLESIDTGREPERFGEFNARLIELAGNQTLVLLTSMLEYIYRAATVHYVRTPHPDHERLGRQAHRARAKLIELIRAGDADGAEDLWRRHLTEAGKVVGADGASVVDLFG
jgi:GntR family transcriptional regulator, transcriptional repressor for pyruvate dehydrogenase complex